MTALIVALVVAALGLFGNIVLDLWKRHHERRTIAAAIAGELGAYLDLLNPDETSKNFRIMASQDPEVRQEHLRGLHSLPTGHPVFDKVADKIGVLDVRDATEISAIYNIVSSMRLMMQNLSSENFCAAPHDFQNSMIRIVASSIEKHSTRGKSLIDRLGIVAAEKFRWIRLSIWVGFGLPFVVIVGLLWKIDALTDETKSQKTEIHDLAGRLSMIADHQVKQPPSNGVDDPQRH